MKLQTNKPINIKSIQGATIPDGIAKIGNLKLESDGTLTYSIHYFLTQVDADNNLEPVSFDTFNMNIPNLENQILANAKTKAQLNQATDI